MKNFILITLFIQVLFNFTSCDNLFFIDESVEKIKEKTTINTFEHLENPIVVTMPVYENYYFLGNENWNSRTDRCGNIFVVIDLETNSVFDWVYYTGGNGWSNWRTIEFTKNDGEKCYIDTSSTVISILYPNKNKVQSLKNPTGGLAEIYTGRGCYLPLITNEYNSLENKSVYKINSVDILTGEILDVTYEFTTDAIGYISYPIPSKDNEYFISYPYENMNCICSFNIQKNTNIYSEIKIPMFDEFSGADGSLYTTEIIFKDYLIIPQETLGTDYSKDEYVIYVYDKNTKSLIKKCFIKNPSKSYVYLCFENNDELYFIMPQEYSDNGKIFHIVKYDIESETSKLIKSINFDLTQNIYTRNNKVYFLSSRDVCNISYLYYDFSTGEIGQTINIRFEDLMKQ